MRCRIHYQKDEIINVPISQEDNLYYIDIQDLINVKVKTYQIKELKKLKTISKLDISRVIKLHDCLQHAASPSVMARAIRFGAWTGVENILPTIVEKVFQYQQCLSCLLGKINRLTHTEGSSIKANVFGKVIAVDWKPVTPISSWGHIGFYFFKNKV